MKTIHTIIQSLMQQLAPLYPQLSEQEMVAWWLLQTITQQDRTQLIMHNTFTLTDDQQDQLKRMVYEHMVQHKPLAYIFGSIPFLNLTLSITPPILIPRPETEEWVAQLIQTYKPLEHETLHILDIATGSGCIGLSLAQALPKSHVWCTDINPQALELAKYNAKKNNLNNVSFIQSDLFEQLPNHKFHLIVSNLPYISSTEYEMLDPMVLQWEDKQALVSGNDGLDHISRLITQVPTYLTSHPLISILELPTIVLEIGHQQGNDVTYLLQSHGYSSIVIRKDLAKKDRVVQAHI